ncbi:MAG TPA: carboxypeptidase regulatory-like domain-containing protein [Longimicrobium sp.]|nr:carboxypeptidase regulatory-like domain-containing protein [Longimicrobium sp.]
MVRFRSAVVAASLGASLLAACVPAQRMVPRSAALPHASHVRDTLVIHGTVRDRKTGEPLPDASVSVGYFLSTVTDSAGGYTLHVPAAGRRKISIRFLEFGYQGVTRTVRTGRRPDAGELSARLTAMTPQELDKQLRICDPGVLVPSRSVGYSFTLIVVSVEPASCSE